MAEKTTNEDAHLWPYDPTQPLEFRGLCRPLGCSSFSSEDCPTRDGNICVQVDEEEAVCLPKCSAISQNQYVGGIWKGSDTCKWEGEVATDGGKCEYSAAGSIDRYLACTSNRDYCRHYEAQPTVSHPRIQICRPFCDSFGTRTQCESQEPHCEWKQLDANAEDSNGVCVITALFFHELLDFEKMQAVLV